MLRGIVIDSLDPTLNLAIEEYLFNTLSPHEPGWFLLWRNGPSIIVGRHQNTAQEVHQELVRQWRLPVVRRVTGGGAVYHDAGNLNFSFLQPQAGGGPLDFGIFLRPIVDTLAALGVTAAFSSRNDLTVGGRKISGSAQLRRAQGVLHHGTLLVDLDLDRLGAVLAGSPDKYQSKGIASLRSRVANLVEVLPPGVGMDELQAALLRRCAGECVSLPGETLRAATRLAEEKYRCWEWNYGASPAFTETRRRRFPWGVVECCLEVRRGNVTACRIYGDYFAQRDTAELEARMVGVRADEAALRAALHGMPWDAYFSGCDGEDVCDLLCRPS